MWITNIVNIIKTELQNKSVDNYLTYRVFDGNQYTYAGETEESELVDYYRIYKFRVGHCVNLLRQLLAHY